ncbi:MAG: hypothetical protein K8S94_05600 [Planctomycetia bacterium]|nr:hypothetical protein [Planctomycetia bacterium]
MTGTISLDGRPLPDGEVYFRIPATGVIEVLPVKDGSFEGLAAAGRHRIEIYRFEQPRPTEAELAGMDPMQRAHATAKRNVIADKYNIASTLEADVQPGQANHFAFELVGSP